MRTFRLPTGHTVSTQRHGATVEFVTRNAEGSVISTVRHSFAESVPLLKRLACSTR
ncbi:gp13 [Streptomyces phage phiBT1]|uniref:Gp13 n=1 Tax=Lomovskayavirus BT1 TaxID=225588 RepID=Q858Y9_9CAUD|nr:gp13 [Streptomyces phage phiBT1]CAD80136.1 gp13 [Lomovskayavirus BT1]